MEKTASITGYFSLRLFTLYPGRLRLSNFLSAVKSMASSCRSAGILLPLVVRKIIALVSNKKRFSVIPFIPEFSLVSHTIAVCIRGKNAEILRNRLVIWGSVRPLVCRLSGLSRSKCKHSLSSRYFAGNINNQLVAGRYFYGLCNCHGESIA